ncbi:hypothetical protein GW17_00009367 [Ensete ventricosum]|nr:hypothetical protein GW17_00009367 [Ensete ventricosum]
MSGTYRSVRLPIRGPPTTGQFRQKSIRPREETKRLPVRGERSRRRFAISTCTTRYGRYITVCQVTGMRTAHYRAVSPKIDRQRSIEGEIDHRRSIEEEKGKKRKRRKKKRRKNTVPSSPARHRCPRRLLRREKDRGGQLTWSKDMIPMWIAVLRPIMAVTSSSRTSRLHKLRVVRGPRSNILHMPPKTQITEIDKVLVKFMRERERERQWMNLSRCDRAYTMSTQNEAHRIRSRHIIKNLTTNNNTVIVGHSSLINNMILRTDH